MANSKSAEKRARQSATRTERNRVLRSRIRTARRKVAEAVEKGDTDAARKAVGTVAAAADRAAKSGVIHKNAANRLKSRANRALSAKA